LRREAVDSIEKQRRDMIAASYSNPNWDGKENAQKRQEYLKELNRHFNNAITRLYYPDGEQAGQDVDWDNPFYAAHRREMARTKELFEWAQDGKTAGEILELAEERKKRRGDSEIDQLET
jgi:uncharacterized protein YnzC (UPF0291/DUF896 family)